MAKSLLLLLALLSGASAALAQTADDTLVVAIPLDGIISFDPAESFETVSNGSLRNVYQTLVEADRQTPQKLAPLLADSWQPGSTPHSLIVNLRPDARPKPLLKRVLLKNVSDAGARRLLIQQGDVDVAYQLGADQVAALQNAPGVRIATFPSSLIYYLGFNTKDAQQPALGNPALWQAARWLVVYDALAAQLLKGQYAVHQSILPNGFDGALETTPFHYDLVKAKALLQQGGIAPGTHFALTVVNQPPYIDVAQALQASFAKADLHIDIQPVAESELWSKMRGRNFQSIFIYWGADYIDPNTNASAFALNVPGGAKTLAWRTGWEIPQLSASTRAAAGESDVAKRRALYTQLQTTVQQDSPFVMMLQGAQQVALRQSLSHARQGIGVSLLYFDEVSK